MNTSRTRVSTFLRENGHLILVALLSMATLVIRNGQTGWHRDELDILDNARYLAWGYVSYPPVSPLLARAALTLFGPSLIGVRLFPGLARAVAIILTGLMARELGGKRWAEALAAVAALVAPVGLLGGVLFSYSAFDFMWWVTVAYFMIRLLKSENPRWWLALGVVLGVGMMTKYTIAYLVLGLVAGVLLTPARRWLRSRWLWAGAGLSLLIVLPNVIWQVRNDFITLDFLTSIHARDIRIGRTEGYLVEQLVFSSHPFTIPIWMSGLYFYFFAAPGRRYRALGWMYLVPFLLLYFTQGRSYYLAAAYPMLFAGGAVAIEGWLARLSATAGRWVKGCIWVALAIGAVPGAALALPIAPVNSSVWNVASDINGELNEQIGWPELVETVAGIFAALPDAQRAQTGILTGNYGEAGAINLYGPAYGLPTAISGVNSYWQRGYGDPPPTRLIILGMNLEEASRYFRACEIVGRATNTLGVLNEESEDHPSILMCGEARRSWPETWERIRTYG